MDESIAIGQEKLLVVLGIRASEIDFTRPLKIQDMEPIIVKSRNHWTGEAVHKELEAAKVMLGNIIYAIADGGGALKKGLKLSNINYVYDVTHAIAIMLEKLYKDKDDFKDFTYQMALTRNKLLNSEYAHLMPPAQRSKSRFLNIDILVNWSIKVLNVLSKNEITQKERNLLQWVSDKRDFIEEMKHIIDLITELSILLKNNGLSLKTKKKCLEILKKCRKSYRSMEFKELFKNYLKTNTTNIKRWSKTILLCSSDVIESTFGKYKEEISKSPLCGITDLVLIIPCFTCNLSNEELKKAFEFSKCKNINEWAEENLCESLLKKRRHIFSNFSNKDEEKFCNS